jgi:glutathione synthase/RimK-type ligase-like ATP-grasp enzyme
MRYIFDTYQPTIGTDTPGVGFQLYGVDVAIDDKLKPMIMEVNKGPDLTAKDGRDKDLKVNLSKDN